MTTRQKRIIIAEDDPNLARSLQFILSAAGYRVAIARNGEEALDCIGKIRAEGAAIDCVITDIVMPRMNGEELIAALRARFIDIPAIVMTAFGDKATIVRLMRLGCNDFIEKPFDPEVIEEHVSAFFDRMRIVSAGKLRTERMASIGTRALSLARELGGTLDTIVENARAAKEEADRSCPYFGKLESIFISASRAASLGKQLPMTGTGPDHDE